MTNTLTSALDKLAKLTPTDPLTLAKTELDSATTEFNSAKAEFDSATDDASASIAALIRKANEQNRKAAEAAQTRLTTAKAAYEAAQTKAVAATEKVHALEKGHKAVNITGADKIQLACAYCAVNGIAYDQEELIAAAVKLTGKDTVGQYGYFRRIARLAGLYGITLTATLPETETETKADA